MYCTGKTGIDAAYMYIVPGQFCQLVVIASLHCCHVNGLWSHTLFFVTSMQYPSLATWWCAASSSACSHCIWSMSLIPRIFPAWTLLPWALSGVVMGKCTPSMPSHQHVQGGLASYQSHQEARLEWKVLNDYVSPERCFPISSSTFHLKMSVFNHVRHIGLSNSLPSLLLAAQISISLLEYRVTEMGILRNT